MAFQQTQDLRSAPSSGPFDMAATIVDGAVAPGTEGIWIDTGFCKSLNLELFGSMSTLGVDVYGSNAPMIPLNQYVVTVGGSATAADILTLIFANQNLAVSPRNVAYTVPTSPTINGVAAGIAAAINADTALQGLGVSAAAVGAVITISSPSSPPGAGYPPSGSPSSPPPSNAIVLTDSLSGGASETLTIAAGTNGTKIGSTIAGFGFTSITTVPRWLTARVVTLTGVGAVATGNVHGTG